MLRAFLPLYLLCASHAMASADTLRSAPHPKQGIVELLLEYLEVQYNSSFYQGDLLYVSVHRQSMFHVRDGHLVREYPISTAKNGLGGQRDSYRTPTGLHIIKEKIGEGVPMMGVFRDRTFTGEIATQESGSDIDHDRITTRVMRMQGMEAGINRGGKYDSLDRCIYIHGTSNEAAIGRPVSRGCIRMLNRDIIELFDRIPVGTPIVILDN
jgi:L,D-transpeptidase YbiS